MSSKSDAKTVAGLTARIEACRICQDAPIGQPLPHEPRPVVRLSSTARLLIAGQAPGIRVHQSGIPFTDPSGDRLRQWMGVESDTFYDTSRISIVPMGFCFPGWDSKGGDLPPRRECQTAWHDEIFAAMTQVEVVLAIGAYAQAYHLARLGHARQRGESLSALVARWRDFLDATPKVIPMPHPSWRNSGWLKRNPWFEAELLPVLRAEVARLVSLSAPWTR